MKKDFKYLKKHKALLEKKDDVVQENVLVVNDGESFKVSKVIDIPKKLINAVLKKAKEESGRDPKIFWNEVAVADEIVKHIIDTYLNAESLPASILTGETSLSDVQGEEEIVSDEIADDLELDSEEEAEEAEEAEEEIADDLELDSEEEAEEADGEDVPSLDSDGPEEDSAEEVE